MTLGIALGSWWAYYELGWGGWWFWDPVENASFMPWLITTALLHSLITCEQKSMFKNWTILLSIIAFSLSLLGTFLVRSGILTSVHSFANDPARGAFILLFLAIITGAALILYLRNSSQMNDKTSFTFFSKESFFLINNILLVTATFTILLGTMYPLMLDIFGLEKISVGVPYYNAVFLPLMIPLVFLAGYIPILFSSSNRNLKSQAKYFLISFLLILIISSFSILLFDEYNLSIFIGLFLFLWILLNLIYELIQKIILTGNLKAITQNIGMFMAHLGLAIFILGATMVENSKTEKEIVVALNEKLDIKNYTFQFMNITESEGPNYTAVIGHFKVYDNGEFLTDMYPEKRLYNSSEMPMTEAGIDAGFSRDLYITMGTLIDQDKWSVRIYHKPLIRLIWIGALMMVFGGIFSVLSKRKNINIGHSS